MPKKPSRKKKAWLLGLGLDNKDGHTRITTTMRYIHVTQKNLTAQLSPLDFLAPVGAPPA